LLVQIRVRNEAGREGVAPEFHIQDQKSLFVERTRIEFVIDTDEEVDPRQHKEEQKCVVNPGTGHVWKRQRPGLPKVLSTIVNLKNVSHHRHSSTGSTVPLPRFCAIVSSAGKQLSPESIFSARRLLLPIPQEDFSRKRGFKNAFRNRDRLLPSFHCVYSLKARSWLSGAFC
jgi:hypothetical protein